MSGGHSGPKCVPSLDWGSLVKERYFSRLEARAAPPSLGRFISSGYGHGFGQVPFDADPD